MAFWGVENLLYGVWHQKHCETEFYQTKHAFSNVHWWTRSHNNLLVTPFLHLVHQCTLKKLWQIWSLEYTCHSWWPPRGWASRCPWGCPRSYFLHDSYLLHYNKSIGIQVLTIWPYILHPEICHITGSICGWDLGQPPIVWAIQYSHVSCIPVLRLGLVFHRVSGFVWSWLV